MSSDATSAADRPSDRGADPPGSKVSAPAWRRFGALPWVVALLSVLPYLPSLGGGFLNYDDPYLVTHNQAIQQGRVAVILDPRGPRPGSARSTSRSAT